MLTKLDISTFILVVNTAQYREIRRAKLAKLKDANAVIDGSFGCLERLRGRKCDVVLIDEPYFFTEDELSEILWSTNKIYGLGTPI